MPYVDPSEVREVGTQITSTSQPTPATDDVLRKIIERASRIFDLACGVPPEYFEPALYPVWQSIHAYIVGDVVTPTTANGHKYRVTTAGTSGASEPAFPTGSGATVTNGTAVFTEYGADVVATARVIYGDGSNYLKLDTYVPGTLNATIALPNGYTAPEFVEHNGYLIRASNGVLPAGLNRTFSDPWLAGVAVTVTAKWGYASTPADVKHAIIELAINLLKETDPASIKLMSLDNQPLREKLPPRVAMCAQKYRVRGVAFV
jgi:hypothetical protein